MKYTYAYKTSDGVRHEAAMDAGSRDAVFAALREKGIRPIKVVAADGSKANGEVLGVRKRVTALVVLSVLCLVLSAVVAFVFGRRGGFIETALPNGVPRQQVYGDPARIQAIAADGFARSFTNAWENFLVRHAVPGVVCRCDWKASPPVASFGDVDTDPVRIPAEASTELVKFIQMVNGMKAEARAYFAAGGRVEDYARLCCERVRTEAGIREQSDRAFARLRAKLEKSSEPGEALQDWEKQNRLLRSFGLETVLVPIEP